MHCPHCKDEVLVAIESHHIEVDYCTGCQGVWLDSGEIELIFGDDDRALEFLSIGSEVTAPIDEGKRLCPECDAVMTKEATDSEPPVVFDHCPNGDGLWFDDKELGTVLQHAESLGADNAVRTFLQDIFPERSE